MTSTEDAAISEDLLYHVIHEIIDYNKDKTGQLRASNVFGTYTSLPVAKAIARGCLKNWGYKVTDFEAYELKDDPEHWKYGDGVVLYAKTKAGQEFRVRLDTKTNVAGLKGNEEGSVPGPLYYVLQTIIEYGNRVWAKQMTEIEGAYPVRTDAINAVYKVLLDEEIGVTKKEYAIYDEKNEVKHKDKWHFGHDTFVHAVAVNGDTFLVEVKKEVKTPPIWDL